ncbi:hypothetical protein UPYG_G00062510 [Umbra pygmaea]|uniref:Ig-like domain-containing protein n=1 Tax=Umbra pygmaea TaxID=75934 RepID=A0ABD0XUI7_UMBPY
MTIKTTGSLLVVFLWYVAGLQVKVTPGTMEQNTSTLTCTTTCKLTNDSTLNYTWYKNGQQLDKPTSFQHSVKEYNTDSYSCAVSGVHSPAVCVLGQSCMAVTYSHQSICALKGSTINISCSFNYPSWNVVENITWFKKWETGAIKNVSQDPEFAGRVKYHQPTDKDSTLRITDLRLTDSAEYKFRFKTNTTSWGYSYPGTTLIVSGLQVKVTHGTMEQHTSTLTCTTTCNLTDDSTLNYTWYKNGQQLDKPTSFQHSVKVYNTDSYSCAVSGVHSPAVCVLGQRCMAVTYFHQSICALKGSSINISCSFKYPSWHVVKNITWFKRWETGAIKNVSQDPEYAGRVEYHQTTDKDSTLRITDLRLTDSAEYKFRFKTNATSWGYSYPGTTLTVTDLKVSPTTKDGKVTLTCSTTCSLSNNYTYIWYKNGQRLTNPVPTAHLTLDPLSDGDRGSYCCAVEGLDTLPSLQCPIGRSNSVNEAAVGIIVCVVILLLCLAGFIWFRKKTSKSKCDRLDTAVIGQRDTSLVYGNVSDMVMTPIAAQTLDTDNQEDLHYASVLHRNQEVSVYVTAQPSQTQEQDEDVQYAAVKFN